MQIADGSDFDGFSFVFSVHVLVGVRHAVSRIRVEFVGLVMRVVKHVPAPVKTPAFHVHPLTCMSLIWQFVYKFAPMDIMKVSETYSFYTFYITKFLSCIFHKITKKLFKMQQEIQYQMDNKRCKMKCFVKKKNIFIIRKRVETFCHKFYASFHHRRNKNRSFTKRTRKKTYL